MSPSTVTPMSRLGSAERLTSNRAPVDVVTVPPLIVPPRSSHEPFRPANASVLPWLFSAPTSQTVPPARRKAPSVGQRKGAANLESPAVAQRQNGAVTPAAGEDKRLAVGNFDVRVQRDAVQRAGSLWADAKDCGVRSVDAAS